MTTTKRLFLLGSAVVLLGCGRGSSPSTGAAGPTPPSPPLPEPTTTGQFGPTAGVKLAYPVRVAAAGGVVYSSDPTTNQVVGTDGDGNVVVALGGLDGPLGLAVAGDLLYVGNRGRQDVEVYSLGQQKYLRSLGGAGAFAMPNAIAVAPDGTVAVADSKRDVVRVFSATGAAMFNVGGTGSANGQLAFPCAVAMDGSRMVVGDQGNHRVQRFDRGGNFVGMTGGEVSRGMCRDDYKGKFTTVAGVALSGGNILVLDSAHAYVQVLDGAGTFQGFMGSAGDCDTCMKLGLDVAVGSDGAVLVSDPEHHRVVTLSPELR